MKKLLIILILSSIIAVAGCQTGPFELGLPTEISANFGDEPAPTITPPPSPWSFTFPPAAPETYDFDEPYVAWTDDHEDMAAQYFALMEAVFDKDDGALWGINLHTPFMFVDHLTRTAIANRPETIHESHIQGEVYTWRLPENQHIGSTATMYKGQMWGMMLWSHAEAAEDSREVLQTMIHEVFHARQEELFGKPLGIDSAFYSNEDIDTRVLIRLELNALLRALKSNNSDDKMEAIHDALSIRNERRERGLMGPADIVKEISEGTATYTHLMLGEKTATARIVQIEKLIEEAAEWGSIRVSATYRLGAGYSILLDATGIEWKEGITFATDLGELLKDTVLLTELKPFDELDLDVYGYSEIVVEATQRFENREVMIEKTVNAFENYPTLRIEGIGDFDFIDNTETLDIPGLGEFGMGIVFYGNFVFSNTAGKITVHDGPLLLDGRNYAIPVPDIVIDENHAYGENWELEVNEGFIIEEQPDGNFRVIKT